MLLCRFDRDRLGVVDGPLVRDVTAALDVLPRHAYPLPRHDLLVASLDRVLAEVRVLLPAASTVPLDAVRLLSPVANPGKIVAAPVNYESHLQEARGDAALHGGSPGGVLGLHAAGLFLKATSALVGPAEGVTIRHPERRTDHEVELVAVIGRRASRVPRQEALACVAGYAVGLDISARGSEDRSFRKSPDSYGVLGPWLATADEVGDPGSLELRLTVNGETRQQSSTRFLIAGVAELIEMASAMYTLEPGDLLFTGTPDGVGPIRPGDVLVAAIERIGTMTVAVRAGEALAVPAVGISSAGES